MKITKIVKTIGSKLPGIDRYHPIHVENMIEVELEEGDDAQDVHMMLQTRLIQMNESDYAAQYKDITGKEPNQR